MDNLFKTYVTSHGEELLYSGTPDLTLLDDLSSGPGDCWHSSYDQGYKNIFPEIKYQTYTAWWYTEDFENVDLCINWRVNLNNMVMRKSIWKVIGKTDSDFSSAAMSGLSLGYRLLTGGAIPLYVKNLYPSSNPEKITIPSNDIYLFYRKHFRSGHDSYMLMRRILKHPFEFISYLKARQTASFIPPLAIQARKLIEIKGQPKVSYIIPTMMRQDFTLQLLDDLSRQRYPLYEVVVVDATPVSQRDEALYKKEIYPFKLTIKWQESKGSCRARNEAIQLCTGDYIVFGDDDIRVPDDYIQKHIQLLQTNGAQACNGLDIRAGHDKETLIDLEARRSKITIIKAGATAGFNNANSCVKREWVDTLKGNDVNYDGGYGEDSDFGLSLAKAGAIVMYNPFAVNLHLKPAAGGYRWWGSQSLLKGKKRKAQPWELDHPVKWIRPVPSPTIMYYNVKHFSPALCKEYKIKYFLYYLVRGKKYMIPFRLLNIPFKLIQYQSSLGYANRLKARGVIHQ